MVGSVSMLAGTSERRRAGPQLAEAQAPPASETGHYGMPAVPRRILHIVSSLERGGIELWLMQVMQTIDRDRYRMDFLVLGDRPGALQQELQSLGSQVLICRSPKNLWQVRRDFADVLDRHGPYDVVHSHVHHYGGLILRLAAGHGVPIRVAHSHNDTRSAEAGASWHRRFYVWLMKRWIRRFATHRIAASRSAAEDLFGPDWADDRRCEIILYGLDFTEFADHGRRAETRQALGLPEDALVIGHVGRFHARKNHSFVLEVGVEVFAREPRAHLLLVGDGELMPAIKARAHQLGIADRVVFTGARTDVAALMQAMDVFVFPSHHEGLGLVLLEAQATGLPCVLSEGIPEEADVVSSLMHRLPLTVPAATWAAAVLEAGDAPHETADRAWQAVCQSDFNLERSAANVLRVYDQTG